MSDYHVIVIGGGSPREHCVPALSRKADGALPNTAITGATQDTEGAQKLVARD